jgi:hypothetical protein
MDDSVDDLGCFHSMKLLRTDKSPVYTIVIITNQSEWGFPIWRWRAPITTTMGNKTILAQEKRERCNILFLGIGGCGKTTCFNHLSIIAENREVTCHLESVIRENAITNVRRALKILLKKETCSIPEYEKYEQLYTMYQTGQNVDYEIQGLSLALSTQYDLSTIAKQNLKDFNFNDEIP